MSEDYEFTNNGLLSGHSQDVKFIKWHPLKNVLYSASYDNLIKSWKYDHSVDDWMCSYTIKGHDSTVWQLDFDVSGDFLASCGDDKNWMIC
jgi:WD40 repeat protein